MCFFILQVFCWWKMGLLSLVVFFFFLLKASLNWETFLGNTLISSLLVDVISSWLVTLEIYCACKTPDCILSFARWLTFVFEDLLQRKQVVVGKREPVKWVSKFLYSFIEEISQLESFCRLDLFCTKVIQHFIMNSIEVLEFCARKQEPRLNVKGIFRGWSS